MNLDSKKIGIILLIIAIALFFVFLQYNKDLDKVEGMKCEEACGIDMGEECPHDKGVPLQTYLGYTLMIILVLIGLFMIFNKKREIKKEFKEPKNLDREEKKIFNLIKENSGTIFQSELIEKTEFSKVKISRILDRLEGKGVIERRRRGMTNVVILKIK